MLLDEIHLHYCTPESNRQSAECTASRCSFTKLHFFKHSSIRSLPSPIGSQPSILPLDHHSRVYLGVWQNYKHVDMWNWMKHGSIISLRSLINSQLNVQPLRVNFRIPSWDIFLFVRADHWSVSLWYVVYLIWNRSMSFLYTKNQKLSSRQHPLY